MNAYEKSLADSLDREKRLEAALRKTVRLYDEGDATDVLEHVDKEGRALLAELDRG